MTESVYDGAQTAADILYGYRRYLRAGMVNLTNEEIKDLIKKLEKCADNSHGPRRHEEVRGLIDICRTELDERDLVHCLVEAGLIVGITNVDVISENDDMGQPDIPAPGLPRVPPREGRGPEGQGQEPLHEA